jgi:hypothetical protein
MTNDDKTNIEILVYLALAITLAAIIPYFFPF